MTVSAALLLTVLCAGYHFADSYLPARYSSARETGYRFYFRVALYAILLSLLASVLWFSAAAMLACIGSFSACPVAEAGILQVARQYAEFVEWPMSGYIALSTLPLSWATAKVLNLRYRREEARRDLLIHIVRNRDLEKLIVYALHSKKPLLVTLDTGKVYAGLVYWAPDPAAPREYLRIMPVRSGHRDSNTQVVRFTTDYRKIVDGIREGRPSDFMHLGLNDFEVVVPANRIVSAHVYDPKVHQYMADRHEV